MLHYPQPKEIAGPSYWGVIHNTAAKYPDNPTEEDKKKMQEFIDYLVSNFVCDSCIVDTQEYMKENKIDYSNRVSVEKYFEDFHNYVNLKLGKKIVNINTTIAHDTCPSCSTTAKRGLKTDLESFKKSARNIIVNSCKEEGLDVPNIYFQPCPDNASTSCIMFVDDKKSDIFINPYSASLRTILHETKHYIDKKKGNSVAEIPADNYAIDKINTNFNFDSYKKENNTSSIMMDEQSIITTEPIVTKTTKYDNLGMEIYHDYPSLHRIDNLFQKPAAYKAKAEVLEAEGEVNKNVFVAANNDDFILSSLNSIFAWPASLVGVHPADLSQPYVGAFLTNIMMYLISSNFSTFGSSFISLISSLSLFSGSIIFKNSIGSGDKRFIQGIIAMLLMSGIESLVPKKREVMSEGLRLFIEGVKTFNLGKIKDALFFDEQVYLINKSVVPEQKNNGKKKMMSGNDKVANALVGNSADINPTRDMQLFSQRSYDMKNFPTQYNMAEKNTVPSYANSSLQSIADSYSKSRFIPSPSQQNYNNLDGVDLTQLADELDEDMSDIMEF